jgi:uncharacterized membrane protein
MTWHLLFVLFMLSNQISSTQYTITIEENGTAYINESVKIRAQEGKIVIPVPFNMVEGSMEARIQGFPVSGETRQISDTTVVELQWAGEEEALVNLDYYVYDITGKEKDRWYVVLPMLSSPVSLFLPENVSVDYIIYEGDFPKITEEGKRLALSWETLSQPLTLYYSFKQGADTTPNYVLPVTFLLSLLLILFLLYSYFSKTRRREVNASILSVLDERERNIVLFLADHGKVKQAKISRATGIPKTTLSKIMARLAERSIVCMEKDGNTTLCWLREEIYR